MANGYLTSEGLEKSAPKQWSSTSNERYVQMPEDLHYKRSSTPYWLLGFVEGDASFKGAPREGFPSFDVSQDKASIDGLKAICYIPRRGRLARRK
jgi:hypothetical protein